MANLREPLLTQTEEPDIVVSPILINTDGNVPEIPCLIRDDNGNDNDNDNVQAFSVCNELWVMATLAGPLAISFFCRMGMASTDSAFVGHIHDAAHTPETYLAAVVLSDMVVNICTAPPLAFNQVLNALVGQAIGSDNPKMAGVWLQQSMFWLSITMLPCLVGLFYVEPILKLLEFPEDIAIVAGTYARYNLIWPIPNGLYQCMRFYFQAQGKPKPAMYNNILFLFINGLLNWIFVFGGPFQYFEFFGHWRGFGFIGAAISLSISRTMQGVVYYFYMFTYKKHHLGTWPDTGCSLANHTRHRTLEFMKQSIPNMGTIFFQSAISQANTVLLGRLGVLPIAASSALSTVSIPWSGTMSATSCTVSGVRVGYHLGRGDANAARKSSWIVLHFITVLTLVMVVVFLLFKRDILDISTDDENVLNLASTVVPAMLVACYLNLLVGNITSGVFSGMGRPFIATLLSLGLELPLSIGGVAVYILYYHGNLLGVYWWGAIAGAIELVIVILIFLRSDWDKCVRDAKRRQESHAPPRLLPRDEEVNETDFDTNPRTE